METHNFTLLLMGAADPQSDTVSNQLFEAGCDDALFGSIDGTDYVEFDREAETLEEAIHSAIADVESVNGISVLRVADPGLMSMADIASEADRSRESARLLISGERGPGGFPPPVNDPQGRNRLWRKTDVEAWFRTYLPELDRDTEAVRAHSVIASINAGLEIRTHRSNVDSAKIQALIDRPVLDVVWVECSLILRPASFGVLNVFGQGQHHGKTQTALS